MRTRLTDAAAEALALKMRAMLGVSHTEAISVKTAIRKLNIQTMYRPMSDAYCGMSMRSADGQMFMLLNSNISRGRQHFTVAHELYHLYYDTDPKPHVCDDGDRGEERNANLFASALLMPQQGVLLMASATDIKSGDIPISAVLRMEQYFEVSRSAMLVRLLGMGLISRERKDTLAGMSAIRTARDYGYPTDLYRQGNANLVISDFGERARRLFDRGRISEGHYSELLNMISDGQED